MTCDEVVVVIFAHNDWHIRPCKMAEELLSGLVNPIRVEEIASDEGQPVPDICDDICGAGDKYSEWVSPYLAASMSLSMIRAIALSSVQPC